MWCYRGLRKVGDALAFPMDFIGRLGRSYLFIYLLTCLCYAPARTTTWYNRIYMAINAISHTFLSNSALYRCMIACQLCKGGQLREQDNRLG
jgi:hypothetical protein